MCEGEKLGVCTYSQTGCSDCKWNIARIKERKM